MFETGMSTLVTKICTEYAKSLGLNFPPCTQQEINAICQWVDKHTVKDLTIEQNGYDVTFRFVAEFGTIKEFTISFAEQINGKLDKPVTPITESAVVIGTDGTVLTKTFDEIVSPVVGKPFELIEEITLTEEVSSIKRNQEPNGENYNFEKIFVYFSPNLSVNMENVYFGIFKDYEQRNGFANLYMTGTNLPSADWYYIMQFNVYTPETSNAIIARGNGVTEKIAFNTNKQPPLSVGDTIKSINISTQNTFPIGSKFKIYGVRA